MLVMKKKTAFTNSPTSPPLYLIDRNNDLYRYRITKLRRIYLSHELGEYEIHELEKARAELVRTKSTNMQKWDWKYQDDIQYLFQKIQNNKCSQLTVNVFKLLQRSYKTILTNDKTEDLEHFHLALVEAVHEWNFRFSADTKKIHAPVWKKILINIAKALQDNLYNFLHQDDDETVYVEEITFTPVKPKLA